MLVGCEDGKVHIGEPYLKKAKVEAEIVEQKRLAKINVIKFKRRKRYMRKLGHKQQHTKLKIVSVSGQPAKKKAASKPYAMRIRPGRPPTTFHDNTLWAIRSLTRCTNRP